MSSSSANTAAIAKRATIVTTCSQCSPRQEGEPQPLEMEQGKPEELAKEMAAPRLPQQVVQPMVITFTRTPAHTMGANLLDYTTKEGQQIYHDACAPLVDKFDGEPMKLKLFLSCMKDKATQYTWMPILTHLVNNRPCNLCDHYGEIT